ncbi:MAG: hypothetical protein KJO07_02270 [Deltaproteobacteria bacterium]|nr:hypothetical protein [Deltaproteobacteria bacterium]
MRLATQELELRDLEIIDDHDSVLVDPLYMASPAMDAIADLLFECPLLLGLRSDALCELSTGSGCFDIEETGKPFALDHGLYIVVDGALICHIGVMSFDIVRGEFAGEHVLVDTLAGITPTFTTRSPATVLHVPAPMVRFLSADSPKLSDTLADGPLLRALMRAAGE